MKSNTVFVLYDGRYTTNPDDAIVYEVCETLREAKENSRDYGTDTVIVETVLVGNVITSSKIINQ